MLGFIFIVYAINNLYLFNLRFFFILFYDNIILLNILYIIWKNI